VKPPLPTPQARIVDENGYPTPEFFRFFQALVTNQSAIATPSGTATRTTFDTATVTTEQLAQRVKALIDDQKSRGAL
jgi:hypothetical protein